MLCANLLTRGHCKFGNKCLFDHPTHLAAAAVAIPNPTSSSPSPLYPSVISPHQHSHQHQSSPYYPNISSSPSSHTSPSTHSVALSVSESDVASSASTHPESVSSSHGCPSATRSSPRGRRDVKYQNQHRAPVASNKAKVYGWTGPGLTQAHLHISQSQIMSSHDQEMYEGYTTHRYTNAYPPPPLPLSSNQYTRKFSNATTISTPTLDRRSSAVSDSTTLATPHAYSPPQHHYNHPQHPFLIPHPLTPTSSNPDMEIYDFSDDEEKEGQVPDVELEKPKVITMYECNKVGVLGGGVKLGFNARVLKSAPLSLDVQTQDDSQGLFDESSADEDDGGEDDHDDADSDVELVILESDEVKWAATIPLPLSTRSSMDLTVSKEPEALPPTEVHAIPMLSLPEDDSPSSQASDSPHLANQSVSPSPSASSSRPRKTSWAEEYDNDGADDDTYFTDAAPLFGGGSPSPRSTTSPTEVKPVPESDVASIDTRPAPVKKILQTCHSTSSSRSSSQDRRRERRAAQRAERERQMESNGSSGPKASVWAQGPPPSLGVGIAPALVAPDQIAVTKPTPPAPIEDIVATPRRPFAHSSPPAPAWKLLPRSEDTVEDETLEIEFPTLSMATKAATVKTDPMPQQSPTPTSPLRQPNLSVPAGSSTFKINPSSRHRNRNRNRSRAASASPGIGAHHQHAPPPSTRPTILAAPQIYDKLGFALSPSAAREVEYLRVVESERLRRAQQQQQSHQPLPPNTMAMVLPYNSAAQYKHPFTWQQPRYAQAKAW
ncbi:hypothetical protein FRB97_001506 [Tulasnella sp. 331]|nr:hypothetical protein FRB97_001506 [Tulasnella sp. 331]